VLHRCFWGRPGALRPRRARRSRCRRLRFAHCWASGARSRCRFDGCPGARRRRRGAGRCWGCRAPSYGARMRCRSQKGQSDHHAEPTRPLKTIEPPRRPFSTTPQWPSHMPNRRPYVTSAPATMSRARLPQARPLMAPSLPKAPWLSLSKAQEDGQGPGQRHLAPGACWPGPSPSSSRRPLSRRFSRITPCLVTIKYFLRTLSTPSHYFDGPL
jgi:hypothetical protein